MLVLSRRPGEKIVLPSVSVLVKVISSQSGLARIGVDAPARVPILREELYDAEAALPAAPAADDRGVADLLSRLGHGLALMRVQLAEGSRGARLLLDALEADLHALGRQLGPAGDEPLEPGLALLGGAGV
jgi:carbon storage regulator CsrA